MLYCIVLLYIAVIDASQGGLLATLGEGLGCVLIKSTLGFGENPEGRDAGNNGEQWGTRGQFTSNLGLKRTIRITAGGRQVSKGRDSQGEVLGVYCT